MSHFRFRRGFNIRLKGSAQPVINDLPLPSAVALKPTDFQGLTPKLSVKEGAFVKAGDPLFFDKANPEILFTSPISGSVKAIVRGERRKILEVVVEPDNKNEYVKFQAIDPQALNRQQVKELLLSSGLWPYFKQRPYGILAKPESTPKNIFISGFDSAPLAPDYELIYKDDIPSIQTGIDILKKLTDGNIYLGLSPKQSIFSKLNNVVVNTFEGPHPAGNVGVQIHRVSPVHKNDIVWTIPIQGVLAVGRFFEKGELDLSTTIALVGSEVTAPQYYKTIVGANLESLLKQATKKDVKERYISGNVLSGTQIEQDGYLGFSDQMVSVIPEGDEYELVGWALPGLDKFSGTKTFLASFLPKKEYVLNANIHGGERAFVMTGQYERYLPMDILPVYLLKAILTNDIDQMEQLGIYEVIEEDLALCEYGDTSKIKVQKILRQGIEVMIKELG